MKTLLRGKLPQSRCTGKWAKELGYKNVEIDPSDAQGIIEGVKFTVQPTFIKK